MQLLALLVALAYAEPEAAPEAAAEASPESWYYGYYGHPYRYYGWGGYYRGYYGYPYRYWWKREAEDQQSGPAPSAAANPEAEASPESWYYGYYGHPYRYYGYGGYYGGYYGYPYRYWWKRSAEDVDPRAPLTSELQGVQKREAEAEASPESWYYGYYGHPYRYYGWGGYYRGK